MALCYMSDYYIYKHNHIDVAVRKTSCEPEDKNFYINFDVHVGNTYNLIFNKNNGYAVDRTWYVDHVHWHLYTCMYTTYPLTYNMFST